MPDIPKEVTDLAGQYQAKVETDLENNGQEQQRRRTDIATLQAELEELERDRELLLGMQRVFTEGGTPTAISPRVPRARREKGAKAESAGKRRKGRTTKPAGKSGKAKSEPTLRELVAERLVSHGGPQSAAEVAAALTELHPKRSINVNVVRNTLEALVTKSAALRNKQQHAVFYTPGSAAPQPVAAPEDEPAAS